MSFIRSRLATRGPQASSLQNVPLVAAGGVRPRSSSTAKRRWQRRHCNTSSMQTHYFLWLGTDGNHCEEGKANIIRLTANTDVKYKRRFLNSCDACLPSWPHGRMGKRLGWLLPSAVWPAYQ